MSKSLKNFITIQQYLSGTDYTTNTTDTDTTNTTDSNNNTNTTNTTNTPTHNNKYAAFDFRILCLQYKYHNSIHFSSEQINIASHYRIKLQTFLNFCITVEKQFHTATSAGVTSEGYRTVLPTIESKALQATLYTIQYNIHEALYDDYNTPLVLKSLYTLYNETHIYGQLILNDTAHSHPIEPLSDVRAYVLKMFSVFGLPLHVLDNAMNVRLVRV